MPFKKNLFYSLFFCINIKSVVFNFLWLTETKIDCPFESVQLGYMMKNGTPAKILTKVLKQNLEKDYTGLCSFIDPPDFTRYNPVLI